MRPTEECLISSLAQMWVPVWWHHEDSLVAGYKQDTYCQKMHWPVFHYSQPSTQFTTNGFTHNLKAGQRIMVTSLLISLLLHYLKTCLVHSLDAGGHGRISTPADATVTVNLGQLQQICFAQSPPIRFTPFLRYLKSCSAPSRADLWAIVCSCWEAGTLRPAPPPAGSS